MDDALDRLYGADYFTTLNLLSGYWQVLTNPHEAEKTAFAILDGLYRFNRVPFGLTNAAVTFRRHVVKVLGSLKQAVALEYFDGIFVYASTFEEHERWLCHILGAISEANLKIKFKKCFFAYGKVYYLGHVISKRGLQPDPLKLRALSDYPPPTCSKELCTFLVFAFYFCRFVHNFAYETHHLTPLLKKETLWQWGPLNRWTSLRSKMPHFLHQHSFISTIILKRSSMPMLAKLAWGAVLPQGDVQGEEWVVAYASTQLSEPKTRYNSLELERLAFFWTLEKFGPYVYGLHCHC